MRHDTKQMVSEDRLILNLDELDRMILAEDAVARQMEDFDLLALKHRKSTFRALQRTKAEQVERLAEHRRTRGETIYTVMEAVERG